MEYQRFNSWQAEAILFPNTSTVVQGPIDSPDQCVMWNIASGLGCRMSTLNGVRRYWTREFSLHSPHTLQSCRCTILHDLTDTFSIRNSNWNFITYVIKPHTRVIKTWIFFVHTIKNGKSAAILHPQKKNIYIRKSFDICSHEFRGQRIEYEGYNRYVLWKLADILLRTSLSFRAQKSTHRKSEMSTK